ncbi:major facilitator superfamily domain-containing protein [Zopfochytrium polystomum]|nr:major facilitator superfamily domain-containing protein [Zopfochytrium polystomum]
MQRRGATKNVPQYINGMGKWEKRKAPSNQTPVLVVWAMADTKTAAAHKDGVVAAHPSPDPAPAAAAEPTTAGKSAGAEARLGESSSSFASLPSFSNDADGGDDDDEPGHTVYKAYWARFLVCAAVFFLNVANAVLGATYVAVTPTSAVFYNTTQWTINSISIVYTAVFVVFIFPATWLLDNKGLRPTLLVGAFGNVVGSALRAFSYFVPESGKLPTLYIGQMIAGISQPFLLNVPTKTAAVWFREKERLTANTVMNLGQSFGIALASVIAPIIVTVDDPSSVNTLNLVTFILSAVMAVPALFAQNKPPTAPSKSADVASTPFWEGARIVLRNKWFILLTVSFAFLLGSFNAFTTFASSYINPYGYTQSDSGNVLVILIVVGTVAAFIFGVVLDRTKQHRLAMKILAVGIAGGVVFYTVSATPDRLPLLYAAAAVIGFCGVPILPLCLEMGVECTHPVAEGTSSGIMWGITQGLSIVFILLSNALTDPSGDMKKAMVMLCALLAVPMVLLQFYNVENRRIRLEASDDAVVRVDEAVEIVHAASKEAAVASKA